MGMPYMPLRLGGGGGENEVLYGIACPGCSGGEARDGTGSCCCKYENVAEFGFSLLALLARLDDALA